MTRKGETHAWFDGLTWSVYSERSSDIRRFESWWGPPTRRGRQGLVAQWDGLEAKAVRVARRVRRRKDAVSRSVSPRQAQ